MPVTPPPRRDEPYGEDDYYDAPGSRTGWFIAGLVALVAVLVGLLVIFANALGIGGDDDGAERIEVPGVILQTEEQARATLTNAGFEVEAEYQANVDHEPGIVFDQRPSPGTREPRGSTVTIIVSAGDEEFPMPEMVGAYEIDAIAELESLGLVLGEIERVFDNDSVDGEVLQQDPPAQTMVTPGTTFNLVVSRGPELVEIPDVRGDELDEARDAIEEAGFQVQVEEENHDSIPEGRVIRTSPAHRTEAPRNSFVVIVVSTGPVPPEEVEVPDVVNLTQATAEQRLTNAGFVPQVSFSPSGSVPSGVVISQDPDGGTPLLQGSNVLIVVSSGSGGSSTTTTTTGSTTSTTEEIPTD